MFDTIAISELQKSLSKVLKEVQGFRYILANNKKKGLIIGAGFMEYLEDIGVLQDWLEDYEDLMLLQKGKESKKELIKKLEAGDMSDFLTFDELCQSN